MDNLQEEELSLPKILKEATSIPKLSRRTFLLITLTLILPLSFASLAHSLFIHPFLTQLRDKTHDVIILTLHFHHTLLILLLFQSIYLLFLFTFSLLSTAAVVFTVASLYTSKPVSFSNTISAIPSVFRRLFNTFLWVSLLMFGYNLAFILLILLILNTESLFILFFLLFLALWMFLFVHVYITALWHLASVVSVLEPVYGLAAMRKSYELLKGKMWTAWLFVNGYFSVCGIISGVFAGVVVHGENTSVFVRILVGGFLVGVLMIVNLVGLLVQSVFYYVCKGFHHEEIDKTALHDQLGGYIGEYLPLKSSIELQSLDA